MKAQQNYTTCKVSDLIAGDIVQLDYCEVEVQRTTSNKVYVCKVTAIPGHGLFSIDVYSPRFADGFNRVERLVLMNEAS